MGSKMWAKPLNEHQTFNTTMSNMTYMRANSAGKFKNLILLMRSEMRAKCLNEHQTFNTAARHISNITYRCEARVNSKTLK